MRQHFRLVHCTHVCSTTPEGIQDEKSVPRAQASYELDKIAKIGGVVNVALAVLKGATGLVCGSSGLLASAADSCSDLVGDGVLLWALSAANKPASAEHPWGHGRLETVASLGTGVLMLGAGASVGWHSAVELYHNYLHVGENILLSQEWIVLGIGAAAVSVVAKEWLFRRTLATAVSVGGSRVLEAHAHHHRSDALSAVAALCGLMGGIAGFPAADALAGVLVSLLIVKQGGKIVYESLSELADAGLEPGELKGMIDTMYAIPGVEGILHERARRLGPFLEFHATILVDPWLSVSGARDLAEECRRYVMQENERVKFCLITTRPKRFAAEPADYVSMDVGWDEVKRVDAKELSHFTRRLITDRLVREAASTFPGITSINRVTLHRMHEDYKHIMTGYVVDITIEVGEENLMHCREIGVNLQRTLEALELPDKSHPVKECDVHMDLTTIPSEAKMPCN
eukprot:CFRG3103T1